MTVILPPAENLLGLLGDPKLYKERLEAIQSKTKEMDALVNEYHLLKKENENRSQELKDKQDMLYEYKKRQDKLDAKIAEESKALNALADRLADRDTVVSIKERELAQKEMVLLAKEGSLSIKEQDFQKRTDNLVKLEADAIAKIEAMDTKERKYKEVMNG
jgi:chromosome segregation ATPase